MNWSIVTFIGSLFVFVLSACGESTLSNRKAKDIIDQHFRAQYDFFVPKNAEFTFEAPKSYKNMLIGKTVGLIAVTHTSSALGTMAMGHTIEKPMMGDTFVVSITDKGKSVPSVQDEQGNFYFLVSNNSIDEILQVTGGPDQQYTVLFSFTEKYTDVGKEVVLAAKGVQWNWTEDNTKFRGKAIIGYDTFLKKLVLKNMLRSHWEKEQWRPAHWTVTDKDQTRIMFGKVDGKG